VDSSSLQLSEAVATWRERSIEVLSIIVRTLSTMGFSESLAHTFEIIQQEGHKVPSARQLQLSLVAAVDLHVEVYEHVRRDFFRAVAAGQVDRECVGGWLNRATRCQSWKRAVPRARAIAYELSVLAHVDSAQEQAPSAELSPEELLVLRDLTTRCGKVLASLPIEDRMLIEAKLEERGYASLAAAWGTTEAALKTRVSRLLKELRQAFEDDESEEPRIENN
jgi:hypothetical protein